MGLARSPFLACLVALLLCSAGAYAGPAQQDEPTIDEMLSAVSGGADEDGPAGTEPDPRPGPRAAPVRPSLATTTELRKLERRVSECHSALRRQRLHWEVVQLLVRVEKFREAASALYPMLKSRDPGRGQSRIRMNMFGEFELEYAVVMTYLGKQRMADQMLAEHKRKLAEALETERGRDYWEGWIRRRIERKNAFLKEFAAHKAQVDELKASLARGPDAGAQLKLVMLCDPEEEKADLCLTWITGILEMIEKHPDHKRVVRGDAHWHLQRAYRYYSMFDQAIEILEGFPERFPDSEMVKENDCPWQLASTHNDCGEFLGMLRDRKGAAASYRKALKLYEQFMADHPKDRRCLPSSDGDPPVVKRRIRDVRAQLRTVGGGE